MFSLPAPGDLKLRDVVTINLIQACVLCMLAIATIKPSLAVESPGLRDNGARRSQGRANQRKGDVVSHCHHSHQVFLSRVSCSVFFLRSQSRSHDMVTKFPGLVKLATLQLADRFS